MTEEKREIKRNTVLLIDDEPVVREIGSELLESLGFDCITAQNGEEGIRLFKENRDIISLLILDIEMPGITGEKIYDMLKAIDPSVHILICSGFSKNHLESQYFKRKLDQSMYMSKPFQLKELSQRLRAILRNNSISTPLPANNHGH